MRKNILKIVFVSVLIITGSFGLKSFDNINNVQFVDESLKRSLFLTPEVIEEYNTKLRDIIQKHDFKGNIALVLNGRLIFEESFGYANLSKKNKTEKNSLFQLASVSKQFTAMAIAILVNNGMLKYDDYVIKYIPEFPYQNISIRHLLNHTSGLQNYVWLLDNKWDKKTFPDNEDLIDLFVKNPLPLNFQPGKKFKYSNTGYAFLASVIERVSGKQYDIFLDENIFIPLEMTNTFVYKKGVTDTLPNLSLGYVKNSDRMVHYENDYNDGILGDKGIYSCLDDLIKWDAALYTDILLPCEALDEMFTYNFTDKGDTVYYGMGWRLPKNQNTPMVYHNGWWHGYRTTLRRYTDDKNTLIILNNTNLNIYPLINDIESLLYPEIKCDSIVSEE